LATPRPRPAASPQSAPRAGVQRSTFSRPIPPLPRARKGAAQRGAAAPKVRRRGRSTREGIVTSSPMASAGASVIPQLASELKLPVRGVTAALDLLGEGATVPFIARYRKERTGGLDEVQLRALAERHTALQELHARRGAV